MINKHGFVKVAAASPRLKVADCIYNAREIINCLKEAEKNQVSIITFPELCITGYTCGDLFLQKSLLKQALESLTEIKDTTKDLNIVAIVGLPLEINNSLYNVAVVLHRGIVFGIVPKAYLPNYNEFYEKRWFSSGLNLPSDLKIKLTANDHKNIPIGVYNLFTLNQTCNFSIEICEDLWAVIPPSSYHTLKGADIVFNLSASNDIVGKHRYRKELVLQQSARCISGYVYASASAGESTTDIVFSGSSFIAENGTLLASNQNRFSIENELIISDIDVEKLQQERIRNKSFADASTLTFAPQISDAYFNETIYTPILKKLEKSISKLFSGTGEERKQDTIVHRKISVSPFSPQNKIDKDEICKELVDIQTAGLGKRLLHTGIRQSVIGVSGGLDSTLALLSVVNTYNKLGFDKKGIYAITMPGFGTSDRTYKNAIDLMTELEITQLEISIKESVLQHFKDIDHNPNIHNVTYENSQARERTQILMDYANKVNGLVIGTGDLSELALGWCTYNGDQMSMYGLNAGVPKTLVKSVVEWFADTIYDKTKIASILHDIVDTPVSPELLPTDEQGQITQKTENSVGPYELHDFFIFYVLRYGFSPSKILFLAQQAFGEKYNIQILIKWMEIFYRRFFTQQFKRSSMPDGPKIGSISLSPRGDWRMPSDASYNIWMHEIEKLKTEYND